METEKRVALLVWANECAGKARHNNRIVVARFFLMIPLQKVFIVDGPAESPGQRTPMMLFHGLAALQHTPFRCAKNLN
jgi:hypothetical protein